MDCKPLYADRKTAPLPGNLSDFESDDEDMFGEKEKSSSDNTLTITNAVNGDICNPIYIQNLKI